MRIKQFSISVFFPCYNDAKSIGRLVLDTHKTLKTLTQDWEIIVINDGSIDTSGQVLIKISQKIPQLKIITHAYNQGYGGALRSGFNAATKDLIFYTDGDGQYDPAELSVLFSLMTDDVDFVNGIKMVRHDPTYRVFIGNFYSYIARWLFWLPVYDVDCDFRLIRKSIIDQISLKSNSGTICIELVKKCQCAGARFRQVSVHHFERRFGQSQFFRPEKLLKTLKEFILLWFTLTFSR